MKIGDITVEKIYVGDVEVTKCELSGVTVYISSGDTPTHDYSKDYLTIDVISGGTIALMVNTGSSACYSVNGGEWTQETEYINQYTNGITVNAGDKVRFKSENFNNNKYLMFTAGVGIVEGGTSYDTALYNLEGNILSLEYGDSFSAETSARSNHQDMFRRCNVISAENLIFPENIYAPGSIGGDSRNAFENCAYLETAPTLPAKVLSGMTYYEMFSGCSNLNYIKCLAETGIGENNNTGDWVIGVSSAGTFIKADNAVWTTGTSGIPDGWIVMSENFNISPYNKSISYSAQTVTFNLKAFDTWTASADSWITLSTTAGTSGSSVLTASVVMNGSQSARTGTITITSNNETISASITQGAAPKFEIVVQSQSTTGVTYHVHSDELPFSATTNDSWVNLVFAGTGGTTPYVWTKVEALFADTMFSSRSGSITFTPSIGDSVVKEYTQNGVNLSSSVTGFTDNTGTGRTQSILVTMPAYCVTNSAYTISVNENWITLSSPTYNGREGIIFNAVLSSNDGSERNATITISANDGVSAQTVTIAVTQKEQGGGGGTLTDFRTFLDTYGVSDNSHTFGSKMYVKQGITFASSVFFSSSSGLTGNPTTANTVYGVRWTGNTKEFQYRDVNEGMINYANLPTTGTETIDGIVYDVYEFGGYDMFLAGTSTSRNKLNNIQIGDFYIVT